MSERSLSKMEKFYVYIKPKEDVFLSPFILCKFIENTIGPIESAKNTKDGLLTKLNETQISKINGSSVANTTLEVVRNDRMNTSRGVIFYPSFKFLTNEDIVNNLSSLGVSEVSRILKRGISQQNEKETTEGRANTGLFILTFKKPRIPPNIKVCFENIEVKPYYPNPFKCLNCHKYGHKKTVCKNARICGNCGENYHEVCPNAPKCINCSESHPAWDNQCTIWQHEKTIIRYAIDYDVSFKEARQRNKTNTHQRSYADTLQTNNEVQNLKDEIKNLQETINKLKKMIPKTATTTIKQPAQNHLIELRAALTTQQHQQQEHQPKVQLQHQEQQLQQQHHPNNHQPSKHPEHNPTMEIDYSPYSTPTIPTPKTKRSPLKKEETKKPRK